MASATKTPTRTIGAFSSTKESWNGSVFKTEQLQAV